MGRRLDTAHDQRVSRPTHLVADRRRGADRWRAGIGAVPAARRRDQRPSEAAWGGHLAAHRRAAAGLSRVAPLALVQAAAGRAEDPAERAVRLVSVPGL